MGKIMEKYFQDYLILKTITIFNIKFIIIDIYN